MVPSDAELRAKALPGSVPDDAIEVATEHLTREQRRSRRKHPTRATSISVVRMPKRELEMGRLLNPDVPHWRPTTRGECALVTRPCPFVSCKHHLYIDVNEKTGSIKMNFPDLEVEELGVSCALDVADKGGETIEDVGSILNITRERVRQVEKKALVHLKVVMPRDEDETRYAARAHQRSATAMPLPPAVEHEEDPTEPLEGGSGANLPSDVERWFEGEA